MIQLERVRSQPIEEYLLTRMAFSPDGGEIAVGHKRFRTLAVETGEPRAEFEFPDFLAQLRYSPDGSVIAAANVGDNHPATRGRVGVFDAASGALRWEATAGQPVEACAFTPASPAALYWNDGAALAGSPLADRQPLPPIPLDRLHLRGLACTDTGVVCFGRESSGAVQQVEGADLVFKKFRLRSLDIRGAVKNDIDLGIGAGVHALAPDGKLLAVEMVDFKNNERHVSLIDTETGVEANLVPLEANTLPVLAFGLGSEFFLCMKEDAEGSFNVLKVWR
ncbi:MAG: hypothetical protein ACRD1L_03020, partial [Terriglobales bacterium]